MRPTCRHGNLLTNSCSFCKVEKKGNLSGRAIPKSSQGSLPTLRCEKCGYSTVYGDALRRHTCDDTVRPTTEETAQELIDNLFRTQSTGTPAGNAIKGLAGLFPGLRRRPKRDNPPKITNEEKRLTMAENYLSSLCGKLDIKTPLLVFTDKMANPGACGEAGQSTIWLHRQSTLTRDWSAVQRTIRHEVAHIVVHNTPGMGEVPAHGAEFDAALAIVEKA